MLSPDHHWALWAILLSTAAFGLWAERTRWGARLSGAVIAIGTTFVLSNLGLIPASAPAYDVVWTYLVPLAIPLLLLNANLKRVIMESGPTLIAFGAGAVGTVLGTFVAFHAMDLGPEGHKLAGIFCATYVGGSINYVATAEALGLQSGDLMTAGIAADNLMMTLYFLVLFTLPSMGFVRRRFTDRMADEETKAAAVAVDLTPPPFRLVDVSCSFALAAVLCAVGYGLAGLMGYPPAAILIVTALAVFLATVFPGWLGNLQGGQEGGTLLMMVFFAALGASANVGIVIEKGAILFLFAALILLVHLAVILTAGKLFKLDLLEVVVASNANMGGPTTSAAMAIARGWGHLVTPAVLCGTFGYAIATFVGTAVGHALA
jgi:uncharacterized membrane protein